MSFYCFFKANTLQYEKRKGCLLLYQIFSFPIGHVRVEIILFFKRVGHVRVKNCLRFVQKTQKRLKNFEDLLDLFAQIW